MSRLDRLRRGDLAITGLGAMILPAIVLGECEVSLHRQSTPEQVEETCTESLQPSALPAGTIWAVVVCPDGSCSQGGPLSDGIGTLTVGDRVALFGLLPPSAGTVEVIVPDSESVAVRLGEGVFLADASRGKDIRFIFKDEEGLIIEERYLLGVWTA